MGTAPGGTAPLSATDKQRLLALQWRQVIVGKEEGSSCTSLSLADWPLDASRPPSSLPREALPTTPPAARLRGAAALNGMALGRLVLKPSLIKSVEAMPKHGM